MEKSEMDALLQAIKRVERKLDTVIRAIYEHDEDIQDEYGRSQRSIEAGYRDQANDQAGDVLGEVRDIQRESRDEYVVREAPSREGSIPSQNVSRKDGRRESKHPGTPRHSKGNNIAK